MAVAQQFMMNNGGASVVVPIAFVQQAANTTATGDAGLTVSAGSRTNGNTVFAQVGYDFTATLTAPTFGGQAMSLIAFNKDASNTAAVEIWARYLDGTETDNNCYAITDTASQLSVHVSEWSGLLNAGAESYEDAQRDTTNTLAMVTTGLTPTSANNLELAAGIYIDGSNQYSSGPTNSFTRMTPTGGSLFQMETIYRIRTADNSGIASDLVLGGSYDWGTVSSAWGGN